MIDTLFRSTFALTIAAAATAIIVASSAAPVAAAETQRTAVIDVRGIDLASPQGRTRVDAEIARTARHLCDNSGDRALAVALANRDCLARTIASATTPGADMAAINPGNSLADAALPTSTVRR